MQGERRPHELDDSGCPDGRRDGDETVAVDEDGRRHGGHPVELHDLALLVQQHRSTVVRAVRCALADYDGASSGRVGKYDLAGSTGRVREEQDRLFRLVEQALERDESTVQV